MPSWDPSGTKKKIPPKAGCASAPREGKEQTRYLQPFWAEEICWTESGTTAWESGVATVKVTDEVRGPGEVLGRACVNRDEVRRSVGAALSGTARMGGCPCRKDAGEH